MPTVYRGTIVHTKSFDEFEAFEEGFVAVENGKIIGIGVDYDNWLSTSKVSADLISEVRLSRFQFLSPGFCDGHIHAPQYAQIGLGMSVPLLDWLNTYTFPTEAKYVDKEFAQKIYRSVVVSIMITIIPYRPIIILYAHLHSHVLRHIHAIKCVSIIIYC